jgi:hypothetical protein
LAEDFRFVVLEAGEGDGAEPTASVDGEDEHEKSVLFRGWVFTYFEEDAVGAGGVDEEVEVAAGSDLNVFGDEAGSLGFEGFEGAGDVVDVEGDVVEAFAAFGEEAADGRVQLGRFEELYAGFACGDHGDADLLLLYGFFVNDGEAKGFVELACLGDAADGDADVVDLGHEDRVQGTGYRVQGQLGAGSWEPGGTIAQLELPGANTFSVS